MGAVLALTSALALCAAGTASPATTQPPSNDNFLFSDNLNTPGTRLNAVNTLQSVTDTIGATVQGNLFAPCGTTTCRTGPSELSTCHGVSYGGTVWYDFYPDHDGQVEIRTAGIPNVIALYSYAARSLIPQEVTCAPGSAYPSDDLFAEVKQGVRYTFQVGGRDGAGGPVKVLFNYAHSSHVAVPPLLTAAVLGMVPGEPRQRRLVALRFIGVTEGEQIAVASPAWSSDSFRRTRQGNVITLHATTPPIVSAGSHVLIVASSPAQVGRFKLYALHPASATLSTVADGCLEPGTDTATAADVEDLSRLGEEPCPTTLVNPTGAEYVFWRGGRGRLWETWYSGRTWSSPLRLSPAGLGSAPAVAVQADGEQDVFWRGAKGDLWEMWYRGSWNGPIDLGTGGLASGPSVGVDAAGNQYVFWRGSDQGLWEQTYAAGDRQWSRPVELNQAGSLGSAPAVAVHPDGEQDVFWQGTNGHLWEMWFIGAWSAPSDLGAGQLGSAPTAGVDAAGNQDIFWRGTDAGLWERSYSSGRWTQAVELTAGPLASSPAVAVQADGEQDVFWQGATGRLREMWFTGTWQGPVNRNARGVKSAPGAGVAAVGKQGPG